MILKYYDFSTYYNITDDISQSFIDIKELSRAYDSILIKYSINI